MLSSKVKCAIQILSEMEKAAAQGSRLSVSDLRMLCGLDSRLVSRTLQLLRNHNWVEYIGTKQVLVKDLVPVTLYELVIDIDGELTLGGIDLSGGWPERYAISLLSAIVFDRQLEEELENRLRSIRLSDLFPCSYHPKELKSKRILNNRTNK